VGLDLPVLCLLARVLSLTWLIAGIMHEDTDMATRNGGLVMSFVFIVRSLFITFWEPYKPGEAKSHWARFFSHKEGGVTDAFAPTLARNISSATRPMSQKQRPQPDTMISVASMKHLEDETITSEAIKWYKVFLKQVSVVIMPMLWFFDVIFTHSIHVMELTISDGAMHRNDDHPHECLSLWWMLSSYTSLENLLCVIYMAFIQKDPYLSLDTRIALFLTVFFCVVFRALLFRHWLRYVHFQSIFQVFAESDQVAQAVEAAKQGKDGASGGTPLRNAKMRRRSGHIDLYSRKEDQNLNHRREKKHASNSLSDSLDGLELMPLGIGEGDRSKSATNYDRV